MFPNAPKSTIWCLFVWKSEDKIMVLGRFIARGVLPFVIIPNQLTLNSILNTSWYHHLLTSRVVTPIEISQIIYYFVMWDIGFVRRDYTIYIKNETCHLSMHTHHYFPKWPANSPYLNPIENLWGIIPENVIKKQIHLIAQLKKLWSEISVYLWYNLVCWCLYDVNILLLPKVTPPNVKYFYMLTIYSFCGQTDL